jgi:hypothetical protein
MMSIDDIFTGHLGDLEGSDPSPSPKPDLQPWTSVAVPLSVVATEYFGMQDVRGLLEGS